MFRKKFLFLGLVIALSACNKNLLIDKEPNMPVQNYLNYSWNEIKEIGNNPYYTSKLMDKTLTAYVDERLKSYGYQKTKAENADFYIDYHIYIKDQSFQQLVCPPGFYRANRYSPELSGAPQCEVPEVMMAYDSGTFVIEIVHKKSGQLIWRGTSTELIENPIYADAIFKRKIRRLLKDLKIKS